jgi:hypothetical protein
MGVRRPAPCAPFEGLGSGEMVKGNRRSDQLRWRRSAAMAMAMTWRRNIRSKNRSARNASTRHDKRTVSPPPKSWMGFSKRHNLIRATHVALHIPVSPLGIAGIYDLQNSLTACRARDGRLRIDRQDFCRLDPAPSFRADFNH